MRCLIACALLSCLKWPEWFISNKRAITVGIVQSLDKLCQHLYLLPRCSPAESLPSSSKLIWSASTLPLSYGAVQYAHALPKRCPLEGTRQAVRHASSLYQLKALDSKCLLIKKFFYNDVEQRRNHYWKALRNECDLQPAKLGIRAADHLKENEKKTEWKDQTAVTVWRGRTVAKHFD